MKRKFRARMAQAIAAAGWILAASTMGAETKQGDWAAASAWYQLEDGTEVLLEPSAREGLFVADFANSRSGSILLDEKGNLIFSLGKDMPKRRLEFQRDAQGGVLGFTLRSESGAEERALRMAQVPYTVEDVKFGSEELVLAGTLYLPAQGDKHPAAVVIHGSGTSHRDNLWYQIIVNRFVRAGVAVLLPDKRGCGKSQGDWESASFTELAQDTIAGLTFMAGRKEIDPNRVGLLGISQGGWIGPLVTGLSSEPAFVINISGTTVTPNEQLVHEFGGGPVANVRAKITRKSRAEWWNKNGDFDPIPYWKKLSIPGLIVYGEEDEQDNVPVKRSVELIRTHLPENRNVTVRVFPDTGHAFFDKKTGEIREDFLQFLIGWTRETNGMR